MLARLKGKRGFTLVELMIVVAIIGVLAALAIYGVRKYVANAKTTEARSTIGRIAKDSANAYNRENMAGAVLATGSVAGVTNRLCGSASKTVPASIDSVKGQKYQSGPAEWNPTSDAATVGWKCLKFSMQDPQYYLYNYFADKEDETATTFSATAAGNLNGDTAYSLFTLKGGVLPSGGGVNIAPNIIEENPEE